MEFNKMDCEYYPSEKGLENLCKTHGKYRIQHIEDCSIDCGVDHLCIGIDCKIDNPHDCRDKNIILTK